MENKSQQFVVLPKKQDGELLKKYEILIYVCIRKYMNKNTRSCYPSLGTIAKDSGCSLALIRKTIKEIVRKGYMTQESTTNGYVYHFSNEKQFEPFSYEFLDNPNLTKSQKLQILCTQQYMFKDPETKDGKISYTNTQLAELTGMSRNVIIQNNKDFIEQGLATQVTLPVKDYETGLAKKETFYHLDKFGQAVVFAIQDLDERTIENSEDIKVLKDELAAVKAELAALKQKPVEFSF